MKQDPIGKKAENPTSPGIWFEGNRRLKTIALVILSAGLATFWAGISHPPGEEQFEDFIAGAVAIGGGLGIIAALAGWFDLLPDQAAMKARTYYGIGAALAAGIGLFVRYYGMFQIGGWDDSTTLEFGWRLYGGQIANKDFPCSYPIAYLLGAKYAFQWFGVYWSSVTDMTALFATVTFAWSFFLLTELFGRHWLTLLWAVAIQASTTIMLSFWWYNPITTVACLLYVLSAALWLRRPASWGAAASYGLALLLLAAMKPNTAGILISLVSAVLFFSSRHRWKLILLSAGAFMLFYMLLSVNSMNITEMIKGYLSAAYRGTTFQHFMLFVNPAEKYSILAATAIVILPLAAIFFRDRKLLLSRRPFIPLIMLVAGGYGYISNSDYYMDLTFVLFAEIFLVAELHSSNASSVNGPIVSMPPGLNRYLAWVCVVLTASGIAQGACREHVKTAGYPLFFEYDGDKYVEDEGYYDGWGYHPLPQQPGAEHQGFFKGVHCGRIFHELLQEEETVLRQAPPSSAIWFGPRLQWGYAAFNKPSPRNQPVWWEPGLSFPAVEEGVYFDRFLASRFNVLILFKNDLSHYSEDEKQRIMAQYDVDQSMQVLTILRLKK